MNKVEYVSIPYVSKPVSRILYGTAMMPFMMGEDGSELLDGITALGINTLDTARNYMESEISIGNWLEKRGNRDKIVILSKCGHPSDFGRKRVNETDMRKDLARSLRYLKTDYIDIYLLHRDDPEVPAGEIIEIFNAMHEEGKIGAFGGSNWTAARVLEANEYAYAHNLVPFSVSSPNFGLARQVCDLWGGGCVTISGKENELSREWYRRTQMPVVAYSSLARGFFSGRLKSAESERAPELLDEYALKGYVSEDNIERLRRAEILADTKGVTVAQIAVAWIFRQGMNMFAVVSTSSPARMQANIDAEALTLTETECRYLNLDQDVL